MRDVDAPIMFSKPTWQAFLSVADKQYLLSAKGNKVGSSLQLQRGATACVDGQSKLALERVYASSPVWFIATAHKSARANTAKPS